MTTHTWIEFGGGFIVLLIALIPSFKIRAMHRAMQPMIEVQGFVPKRWPVSVMI